MTSERYASIMKKALAGEGLSDSEVKELAKMPEYQSLEAFVDEVLNDVNSVEYEGGDENKPIYTFNLSDVQVLVWGFYKQWVKAGKPSGPDAKIKPLGNTQVINELKQWGLTYSHSGTDRPKTQPRLISKMPPKPEPPDPSRPQRRRIDLT